VQTTPEAEALLRELYERSLIVEELDGPQIEAWVSGLFPLFDDDVTPGTFVDYCVQQQSAVGQLLAMAVAELLEGVDDQPMSDLVQEAVQRSWSKGSVASEQIGQSVIEAAWLVDAPFGRSVVLGFENRVVAEAEDDEEASDIRHSILVEVNRAGALEDLQLAGAPRELLDEAAAADSRVIVRELPIDEAVALIIGVWPGRNESIVDVGPGIGANQQFVRRRLRQAHGVELPPIVARDKVVDIRRGLDDQEFGRANRAALSTLQAALGDLPREQVELADPEVVGIWAGLIRGDGGELPARERDALLWLEWADWLGAGIGILRAGPGAVVTGSALVDYVNRCPEVSSTIEKGDREYAEWAFSVALDVLEDAGALTEGVIGERGVTAVGAAMLAAWSPRAESTTE